MFNVNEEIDDIIDEINDDFCESAYEEIYDELCYRVECGELSLEDAEIINEAAYDRYVLEKTGLDKWAKKEMQKANDLYAKAELFGKNGYTYKYLDNNKAAGKIADKEIRTLIYKNPTQSKHRQESNPKYYKFNITPRSINNLKETGKNTWNGYVKKQIKKAYGYGDTPINKEPGKFLRMQKELDKINGKKR